MFSRTYIRQKLGHVGWAENIFSHYILVFILLFFGNIIGILSFYIFSYGYSLQTTMSNQRKEAPSTRKSRFGLIEWEERTISVSKPERKTTATPTESTSKQQIQNMNSVSTKQTKRVKSMITDMELI